MSKPVILHIKPKLFGIASPYTKFRCTIRKHTFCVDCIQNKRQLRFSIRPKALHGPNPLGPLRVKQFGAQRSTFFIIIFLFSPNLSGLTTGKAFDIY